MLGKAINLVSPEQLVIGQLSTVQRIKQCNLATQRKFNTVCTFDGDPVKLTDLYRRQDWPE